MPCEVCLAFCNSSDAQAPGAGWLSLHFQVDVAFIHCSGAFDMIPATSGEGDLSKLTFILAHINYYRFPLQPLDSTQWSKVKRGWLGQLLQLTWSLY